MRTAGCFREQSGGWGSTGIGKGAGEVQGAVAVLCAPRAASCRRESHHLLQQQCVRHSKVFFLGSQS